MKSIGNKKKTKKLLMTEKKFILMIVFAIIMSIVIIYVGLKGFIHVNLLKNYQKATAKVIFSSVEEMKDKQGYDSGSHQRVVDYTYFINNKQYKGKGYLWWRIFNSSNNFERGNEITIIYKVNNPSKSEIYHISYVMTAFGIVFIIFLTLTLKEKLKNSF